MALAQVVYTLSTDADFAARMRSNPERALEERGWRLDKEELALLLSAITRYGKEKIDGLIIPYIKWF
jgi:hypothetical protein